MGASPVPIWSRHANTFFSSLRANLSRSIILTGTRRSPIRQLAEHRGCNTPTHPPDLICPRERASVVASKTTRHHRAVVACRLPSCPDLLPAHSLCLEGRGARTRICTASRRSVWSTAVTTDEANGALLASFTVESQHLEVLTDKQLPAVLCQVLPEHFATPTSARKACRKKRVRVNGVVEACARCACDQYSLRVLSEQTPCSY
eukprot:6391911-Pyramimonas_sp.AAC.2